MVSIFEGSDMVLSVWAYDVTAVSLNPKGPGIQITIRSGPWFAADVSVGEFMTASASAMQMYIKEERMLRAVRAA
jgi:hypothetical protein